MKIPFHKPYLTGREEAYISDALHRGPHSGNGPYAEKCLTLLREKFGFAHVFLTPSCTAALEMGALLANLKPGDEVILPSYTFSSTANAVVLRGARPVFCEVVPATMNLDSRRIEALITPRTRMIVPVDYAGIPCDIEAINEIADKHGLIVMQDAAQSFHSRYRNRPCGSDAPLAAFSFHESKNLSCGEGGALVVNNPDFVERATFLQEKGTDRSLVVKGIRSKYRWVDVGSSFLLADLLAAMLLAQLEAVEVITARRSQITQAYHNLFEPYRQMGLVSLPQPPAHVTVNHHAFFVIFATSGTRDQFLAGCRKHDIHPYIGYMPLHSSAMGRKFGYQAEDLPVTEDLAGRIARLPFYTSLADEGLDYCLEAMRKVLEELFQ